MSGVCTAYSSRPIRKITTKNKLVKNWSYEKSETAKLINLSKTAIKTTIRQKSINKWVVWRAREIVLKTKLRWYRRRGSVGAVVVVKVQLLPYDKP
jgi:hypothetical protein